MDNVSTLLSPSSTSFLSLLLCLCLDTEQPLPPAPLKTNQIDSVFPRLDSRMMVRRLGPHTGEEEGVSGEALF